MIRPRPTGNVSSKEACHALRAAPNMCRGHRSWDGPKSEHWVGSAACHVKTAAPPGANNRANWNVGVLISQRAGAIDLRCLSNTDSRSTKARSLSDTTHDRAAPYSTYSAYTYTVLPSPARQLRETASCRLHSLPSSPSFDECGSCVCGASLFIRM